MCPRRENADNRHHAVPVKHIERLARSSHPRGETWHQAYCLILAGIRADETPLAPSHMDSMQWLGEAGSARQSCANLELSGDSRFYRCGGSAGWHGRKRRSRASCFPFNCAQQTPRASTKITPESRLQVRHRQDWRKRVARSRSASCAIFGARLVPRLPIRHAGLNGKQEVLAVYACKCTSLCCPRNGTRPAPVRIPWFLDSIGHICFTATALQSGKAQANAVAKPGYRPAQVACHGRAGRRIREGRMKDVMSLSSYMKSDPQCICKLLSARLERTDGAGR